MSVNIPPDGPPPMSDDQATLGTFAEADAGEPDDGATDETTGTASGTSSDDGGADPPAEPAGATEDGDGEVLDDPVCPWCLAPDDRFTETGPTGLACGRCSAALPVDADWFRAREVVARRPMYDVETGG